VLPGKELHSSVLLSLTDLLPVSSRYQALYPKSPEPLYFLIFCLLLGFFRNIYSHMVRVSQFLYLCSLLLQYSEQSVDSCLLLCITFFYIWISCWICIWIFLHLYLLHPCLEIARPTQKHCLHCTFPISLLLQGGADKSLARPGRKQATAIKLGIYSAYSPQSPIHFLARCSNFCKPLKKIQKVVCPTRSLQQQ